jgi:hypothetical protein
LWWKTSEEEGGWLVPHWGCVRKGVTVTREKLNERADGVTVRSRLYRVRGAYSVPNLFSIVRKDPGGESLIHISFSDLDLWLLSGESKNSPVQFITKNSYSGLKSTGS